MSGRGTASSIEVHFYEIMVSRDNDMCYSELHWSLTQSVRSHKLAVLKKIGEKKALVFFGKKRLYLTGSKHDY